MPNTLYEFYEAEYGVIIVHATERLRAAGAGAEDAQLLGVKEGAPLLFIDRRALDIQYRPVEWRTSACSTEFHYYFNQLD